MIPFDHKSLQLRKVLMIGLMALGIAFTVDFIFKVQKGQIFARSNAELNLEQKLSSQLPWLKYSEKILHDSLRSQKPVIFDFYADWCVACHELAKKTFANKTVSDRLGDFILIQFDATNDSEELKSLKQTFKIVGLPTVLFFDKKGQWLEHQTLTEFEDADQFLIRLKKIDGEK
jgi:thiol:disulfide interchange protein DsbD